MESFSVQLALGVRETHEEGELEEERGSFLFSTTAR